VGGESGKGHEIIKQAFSELSQIQNINFVGNVEGDEILKGKIDVALCDGFLGNVLLKFLESVGGFVFSEMKEIYNKGTLSKLSALAVRKKLGRFKQRLDPAELGGVPLLGVNGIVIKSHGGSTSKAIKNSVLTAKKFAQTNVLGLLRNTFQD